MLGSVLKFCAVGAIVCGLDFTALWTLKQWLPRLTAVSIAYFVAVTVHFTLNKWWVFKARSPVSPPELARYLTTVLACWLCTVGIVALALRYATANVFIAKLLAIPPTTVLGFALMRAFVFR